MLKSYLFRLAFLLLVLTLSWIGTSTAGSGTMVCSDGSFPCSSFDHGSCSYHYDAVHNCCVSSGTCPGYCCVDDPPPPPPPPDAMVCDGTSYPCSSFNHGGCSYHYDAVNNCCVSSGTCLGYCCV